MADRRYYCREGLSSRRCWQLEARRQIIEVCAQCRDQPPPRFPRHHVASLASLLPSRFFFFFFFFHLTYSRWTSSLPSCLWSQRIFPSLPGSCLTFFLSRCKFSTLTTRQPMVEFYLLTFPRFPLRKKEHKSYFGKNRTHDFRTSRCAAYLLDHSGDERRLEDLDLFIAASLMVG